ncbi:divergent polysaccharide deacetylase family protein [Tissierella sp. MSJ-40]|uniref:Divergent polysaccharide deacetylase family protein n=1 Tax=Tissierella simiarum TaxID=2841534 RepID=A0ABS6E138_9FIRM|nr:divergent polysaccharide deacetylase family protein [Tissierella simiarum]MBU5436556.1 divergent polysaccharide deacetylase family protein [Tissierella simiarum]
MFLYINKRMLLVLLLILILIVGFIVFRIIFKQKSIQTNATPKGYIALVINDLGNNGEGIEELMKLDIPITGAVMPFLEYSKIDSEKCYNAGMEIILHLPMESESGPISWSGPNPITCAKSNEEVRKNVEDGIKEIKWAKGINNHMGSRVMKNERIMKEVLKVAKEKGLYFLDSRTGEYSVAERLTKELDIVYFYRDIFLDNSKREQDIVDSMEKLGQIALEKGYAVGIGHVGGQGGKITIEVIDKMSKKLQEQGIEFIYLSQIEKLNP